MSRSTETVHVRGVARHEVVLAIDAHMTALGFVRDPQGDRLVLIREDGAWISLADEAGFTDSTVAAWGTHLSRVLRCPVLTIMTWDGEESVQAKRWEDGRAQASLALLSEAKWGPDGRPHAPARALAPWLDETVRTIKLEDAAGNTAVRIDADDEDDVEAPFVPIRVSLAAIGNAVGLTRPDLSPREPQEGDEQRIYSKAK